MSRLEQTWVVQLFGSGFLCGEGTAPRDGDGNGMHAGNQNKEQGVGGDGV